MKVIISLFSIILFAYTQVFSQITMESEIYLADVRMKEGNIYFGAAKNVTNSKGYDNQPYFLNDSMMLYTHIGDDLQADIYSYYLKSKKHINFTKTSISEYSARLTPSKDAVCVVEVEQDSTQRIWAYDLNGRNGKVLIPYFDSVGYYAWLNDSCVAAFILTEPPSLQICSTKKTQVKTVAKNIGRCLQVSSNELLYFTMLENDSVRWLCSMEPNGKINKLIEFYKGVEDFVVSTQNIVFCAKGAMIYYSDQNYTLGWRLCGNFEAAGITHINRIALSPDNKKMALVDVIKQ